MNVESKILELDRKIELVWEAIQRSSFAMGLGSNLQPNSKRFKKQTTKDEIRKAIVNSWNIKHPLYPVKL